MLLGDMILYYGWVTRHHPGKSMVLFFNWPVTTYGYTNLKV